MKQRLWLVTGWVDMRSITATTIVAPTKEQAIGALIENVRIAKQQEIFGVEAFDVTNAAQEWVKANE